MVCEKQVRMSLRISVRRASYTELAAGDCAKPTPASQMYSQLSIDVTSSGWSCTQSSNIEALNDSQSTVK